MAAAETMAEFSCEFKFLKCSAGYVLWDIEKGFCWETQQFSSRAFEAFFGFLVPHNVHTLKYLSPLYLYVIVPTVLDARFSAELQHDIHKISENVL